MGNINIPRWLLGGVAAGILIWLSEGAASLLYFDDMQAALTAHGLAIAMSAATWVTSTAVSLISGLTLVSFYAIARPRLGPGPGTATTVAVALWIGGYLPSLLGYQMIGL